MNDFYVYSHETILPRQKGNVFYIGKGRGKRAYAKDGRNKYWLKIIKKYGYQVKILFKDLTETEALRLEIQIIANYEKGKLCNLTNGGEGVSGHKHSVETLLKLKTSHLGVKLSEDRRLKHIDNLREISNRPDVKLKNSIRMKKFTLSEESRKKISETLKGHPIAEKARIKFLQQAVSKRKAVICSNGLSFESITMAVEWLKINGKQNAAKSNIQRVCDKERNSAYGLGWDYDQTS